MSFDATIEVVETATDHVTQRVRATREDVDEMANQIDAYLDHERFFLRIVWH